MAESPQLPDRIQKDLEDALRDGGVDKLPSRPRRRRRPLRLRLPDPRPRNPGELVLYGVVLGLVGYFVPPLRGLFLLGLACLALAIVTHFLQPQGQRPKYWRGRYLDVPSGQWPERLYRLIYRRSI